MFQILTYFQHHQVFRDIDLFSASPASVRSGFGLLLVGRVCSLFPPWPSNISLKTMILFIKEFCSIFLAHIILEYSTFLFHIIIEYWTFLAHLCEKFSLLAVSPFHPSILEPDFHLKMFIINLYFFFVLIIITIV